MSGHVVSPTSIMVWPSAEHTAQSQAEALRRAVRRHWQKAVRRQVAVNRLAGRAAPGTGGLWEEATKKGELRHTAAILHARRLLDEDTEHLVEHAAKMEEERDEAVAALKLNQVVERVERLRLAAEAHTAKTKAAAQQATLLAAQRNLTQAQQEVGRLREQAAKAQWRVREAEIRVETIFRKKLDYKKNVHKTEVAALRAELSRDEDHWLADIEFLERQVRELRALTEFMIQAPGKRARIEAASSLLT